MSGCHTSNEVGRRLRLQINARTKSPRDCSPRPGIMALILARSSYLAHGAWPICRGDYGSRERSHELRASLARNGERSKLRVLGCVLALMLMMLSPASALDVFCGWKSSGGSCK